MKMKPTKLLPTNPEQFQHMTELLAELSDYTNRLQRLENGLNANFLTILKSKVEDYSAIQAVLTEAEKQIKTIAARNPQWFTERATLKTPYGAVKQTTGTSLVTDSEDLSIQLIEQQAQFDAARAEQDPTFVPALKLDALIRQKKELDREALEKLDDQTLRRFGIRRETRTDIKVTPANVDMGKAVEEAIAAEGRVTTSPTSKAA